MGLQFLESVFYYSKLRFEAESKHTFFFSDPKEKKVSILNRGVFDKICHKIILCDVNTHTKLIRMYFLKTWAQMC